MSVFARVLPAIALVGCDASPNERFVDAPADEQALRFYVQLESGRALRTWSAAELDSGPIKVPEGDTTQLALVSVAQSELLRLDPILAKESLDQLTLVTSPPCPDCGGVCLEQQTTRLSVALPSATDYYELDESGFAPASEAVRSRVVGQTRLELLRTIDACTWGGGSRPELFGSADFRLEREDRQVEVIDADRVVVKQLGSVRLIPRGGNAADGERRMLSVDELDHEFILGTAVLSRTSTSARLLLINRSREDEGPEQSTVYEIEVSEQGIHVVGIRGRVEGLLQSIITLDDGGFIAVGSPGLVVISRLNQPLLSYSLPGSLVLTSVASFDGELGGHHVGGSFGSVAEGDLFAGPRAMRVTALRRAGSLVDASVLSIRARNGPEGAEVWATTPGQGAFRRRGPGDWVAVDIDAPPGVTECTTQPDACGRSRVVERMRGFGFASDGRILYAPQDCFAIFTLGHGDPCTQQLELEETGEGLFSLMRVEENRLYFARDLRLWSIEI